MRRRENSHPPPQAAETERLGSGAGEPVLGRYRLEHRLGAGGFGVVWSAYDEKLERDVAVKVVPREEGDQERSRVEREALAAARLNHPGIVALYEMGSDDHDVYLVSELVRGATLQELSREGALSDRDVARIGAVLCEALEHAHARGVIHRDVKPANVMVLAEPAAGAGFAKLTDFGIAHLGGCDTLTATGDVVGTLAYMAPEQAEGRRVTAACDVYSLALTLYEAWTGVNPVRAESPAATARGLGRPLPPLRYRRPDLPAALADVIDMALDPEPGFRPDPVELREQLLEAQRSLSDEGGLVEPETIERFGLKPARTRTRLLTLLGRRQQAHPRMPGADPPRVTRQPDGPAVEPPRRPEHAVSPAI
ncbi:MAG: serine/threonine protein kinase, partial [Actinomycetota bacterium]|nr:serine/threonine protein kinase [Actinomycetota bacterium]